MVHPGFFGSSWARSCLMCWFILVFFGSSRFASFSELVHPGFFGSSDCLGQRLMRYPRIKCWIWALAAFEVRSGIWCAASGMVGGGYLSKAMPPRTRCNSRYPNGNVWSATGEKAGDRSKQLAAQFASCRRGEAPAFGSPARGRWMNQTWVRGGRDEPTRRAGNPRLYR